MRRGMCVCKFAYHHCSVLSPASGSVDVCRTVVIFIHQSVCLEVCLCANVCMRGFEVSCTEHPGFSFSQIFPCVRARACCVCMRYICESINV